MKSVSNILSALLLNSILAASICIIFPSIPFAACIGAVFSLSLLVGYIGRKQPKASGMAFNGLFKEVWIDDLQGRFWDNNDFLMDGANWDPFVENDAINLAEIGVEPTVVKNRTVWPVPAAERPDTPIRLPLDIYSTDSTVHHKLESVELSYDKRQSIISDHKSALLQRIADDGMYNVAPAANSAFTPVFFTTGAADAFGNKALLAEDVAAFAAACDEAKMPQEGRVLALPPTMFWGFVSKDPVLKAQAGYNGKGGTGTGSFVEYYNFTIRSRNVPVLFDATGTKLPQGSVSGGKRGGIFYVKGQTFGRGMGSAEMFARLDDPEQQGDVINFGQRAIVLPKRNKLRGAIVFG